jgi:hypothetical protein
MGYDVTAYMHKVMSIKSPLLHVLHIDRGKVLAFIEFIFFNENLPLAQLFSETSSVPFPFEKNWA